MIERLTFDKQLNGVHFLIVKAKDGGVLSSAMLQSESELAYNADDTGQYATTITITIKMRFVFLQ